MNVSDNRPDLTANGLRQVCSLDELQGKTRVLFRQGKSQLVVFYSQGQVFAIDNRCPHEGYPLMQGHLDAEQCTLTCQWHNWKFDLRSGEAKVGQDPVRSYPTRIEEGQVWVDLSPPDPQRLQQKLLASLQEGFEKRQYGRMARDLARVYYQGLDPLAALRQAIVWSHNRLEFGMTHAYAVSADWIFLYLTQQDLAARLTALTEALDHMALDSLREREYSFNPAKADYSPAALLAAIESEDETQASALLNGALAAEADFEGLLQTLAQAALAHYNDFGHSLIYLTKVYELVSQLGPEVKGPLLRSLVRSLIYATREDLLPDFQAYGPSLEALQTQVAHAGWGHNSQPPEITALRGAAVKPALRWVLEVAQHHTPAAIYQSLLLANAEQLLQFDTRFAHTTHNPVKDNVDWLDFTHALTFANAVRTSAELWPELADKLWPAGLLQMAAFYGRNTPYTDPGLPIGAAPETPDFWQDTYRQVLDHGLAAPIFAAHLLKTTRALEQELPALNPAAQEVLRAALLRFLNAPLKQRHGLRLVRQGLQLVGRDFDSALSQ